MLDTKDIIILTASFYLATVVSKFFTSLTDDIITPLLSPVAAAGKGVSSFTLTFGGVTLKVGEFLSALVQLVISFAVVVYAIGVLRTYALSKIGASRVAA